MRCGRDEEPDQVQQPIEKSIWFAHVAWLWTHVVDSKKQTLRGLKKIANDLQ
jgi:hypothetical protein